MTGRVVFMMNERSYMMGEMNLPLCEARYGHATLKRLLVAAALFDVFDEPLPGSGSRTIYRLRSADVPLRSINRDPQSPRPPAT